MTEAGEAVYRMGKPTRTTLRESALEQLRTAILTGEIPPGAHLGEVGLSASLGISRATLREGLRQLQDEGLAEQDARGRVFVRTVSARDVRDLFEVRSALELIAIRRLCTAPGRDAIVAELREHLERLRDPVSLAAGLDADLDFHRAICRLSDNEALLTSWAKVSGMVRVTMVASGADAARQNMSFERHAPIVDLVEQGDAAAACEFMEAHMASALDHLLERLDAEE